MKKHEILSPQSRAALFDPPIDPAAIIRHYTFSCDDMALIRQRRRDANRLGFAAHLAYLRFPGRVLGAEEVLPPDVLAFIASQIGSEPKAFAGYAQRDETRWEHLGELQNYLGVRPFQRQDYRATAKAALDEAIGSDRGDAIVAAQIGHLRGHGILLPAATILERIGLAARARARKQAHKNLVEGLEHETIAGLEASDRGRKRPRPNTARVGARMAGSANPEEPCRGCRTPSSHPESRRRRRSGTTDSSRALRGNRSGNRHSERSTSLAVRCAAPIGHSGRFRS